MESSVLLRLKNDVSELDRLSEAVEEFGHIHQLPPKAIFELNLALDEIITNIISYGYSDEAEHDIQIHFTFDLGQLKVSITDDGVAFDPFTLASPDLDAPAEERAVGGLGFHFVRTVMNKVEYRRDKDCNVLTLYKNITGLLENV